MGIFIHFQIRRKRENRTRIAIIIMALLSCSHFFVVFSLSVGSRKENE